MTKPVKPRLWSYWKYEGNYELSFWQVVPKPDENSKGHNAIHIYDDLWLKCIMDATTKEDYARANPGEVYSYRTRNLSIGWEPILKDDIPLYILSVIP